MNWNTFRINDSNIQFLIGLNVIGWAIGGLIYSFLNSDVNLVRITISILNIIVGILFLLRNNKLTKLKITQHSFWIAALISHAILFKFSPDTADWNPSAQITFLIGGVISAIGLINLGREFGIRPGLRNVVSKGLYSIVRHPIYFGEVLLSIGCVFAKVSILSCILLVCFLLFQGLRILDEERILKSSDSYTAYQVKTKWRLIPGVW